MSTLPLFDVVASERAKQEGMEQAADSKRELLEHAREIAAAIAILRGPITMDDVVEALVTDGYSPHALGNSAGSVFKTEDWEWTGRFIPSERVHAHGNPLREWRYIGA